MPRACCRTARGLQRGIRPATAWHQFATGLGGGGCKSPIPLLTSPGKYSKSSGIKIWRSIIIERITISKKEDVVLTLYLRGCHEPPPLHFYFFSLGILSLIVSCASAESQLRARAEAGEAEAQYQLASMYWEGRGVERNPPQALTWYQRAADRGHREAQVKVAELYERGEGISQDYVQASRMYAKAAEQGDPKSEIRLAQLYLMGQGVPQNYAEAKKLLERAGKEGCRSSVPARQDILGRARVTTDRVQAHKWFNLAAAQGHKHAATLRQIVAMEMDRDQVVEAQRLAAEQSRSQ